MDTLKTKLSKKGTTRNLIIIVVVGAVFAAAYFIFINKGNSGDVGGLATVAGTNTSATDITLTSQDFLTQLLKIDSIKIDDKIATNPAFTVLVDLSKPIDPDTNPGRINPFAPLGADSATVSTQITTNQPSLLLATSAVLNGTLGISGQKINRWFEYGITDALGAKTPETAQSTIGVFSENVTGLLPDTTYYVKAVASVDGQIISGDLLTWKTSPLKRSAN